MSAVEIYTSHFFSERDRDHSAFELAINLDDGIDTIKQRIYLKTKIPINHQRLLWVEAGTHRAFENGPFPCRFNADDSPKGLGCSLFSPGMELTTSHGSLREIGVSLGGSLHLMTAAQSPQQHAAGQAQHRAAGQAQCSVPGSWGPPGYRRFGASDGTTPLGCERCANSCNSPAPGWLANGCDVTGRPQCRRCTCNSIDGALSRLDAIEFEQRNHESVGF